MTTLEIPRALHRGESELPFVALGDGTHLQLLQVRHVLPPDRVARLLDQIRHRGRDPELEVVRRLLQSREVGEVLRAESVHQLLQ